MKAGYILFQETLVETSLNLSSIRPILKFIAKLSTPSLGLTFGSWSYVTTAITFDLAVLLFLADLDSAVYPDIECRITLLDRI